MSTEYGWKFILDGTTDITNTVTSFSITSSLDAYCRELTFAVTDEDLYYSFNFAIIPESPRVEVFTRILALDQTDEYGDEYDTAWISQGTFFIERPTFSIETQSVTMGIWGRQSTAVLGEPFAQKVTKIWDTDISFFSIVEELLESVGLTWEDSRSDIQDFTVYADNFEADDIYPIDVLRNLVTLVVGAEGFITSDRLGNICIKRLDREPSSSDYDLTDSVVQSISEDPEWPEFGNRIKVIPTATVSQNTIELLITKECIGSGAPSYIDMYAQVLDGNGVPLSEAVVDWSFDPVNPENVWFKYPTQAKTAKQNTGRMLICKEKQKATGVNSVSTTFSVDELVGVWLAADLLRTKNFAPVDGYIIDGKDIYLTTESFAFCDQSVVISYYSAGIVQNTLVYDSEDEYGSDVLYGSITVVASTSGKEDSKVIYVDNSCHCLPTLAVTTNTTTIDFRPNWVDDGRQANEVLIMAFLENSGEAISGTIRMVEVTGNATLYPTGGQTTHNVFVTEETTAINSITGRSQCSISVSPVAGYDIWIERTDTNPPDGNYSNLFYAVNGTTIDLARFVATGTSLTVQYVRGGGVYCILTAVYKSATQVDSESKVIVYADVAIEAGLSVTVNTTVTGYRASTTVAGFSYEYINYGMYSVAGIGAGRCGPYQARVKVYYDGVFLLTLYPDNATITVTGTGSLQTDGMYVVWGTLTPAQTFTVTMQIPSYTVSIPVHGAITVPAGSASLSVVFTR